MKELMGETTNCLVCHKRAKLWTGYVKKGKIGVCAGFCSMIHLRAANRKRYSSVISNLFHPGRFGTWKKEFGFKPLYSDSDIQKPQ
jgi:hypothetical protein